MKLVSLFMSIVIGFQIFPTLIDESPLAEMEEVARKQEIEVTNWKVYMKAANQSVASGQELKSELLDLMEQHATHSWKMVGDEQDDHYKYIGNQNNKIGTENIIVTVYQVATGYNISVSYELSGKTLTEEMISYIKSTYKHELEHNEVYYTIYGSKSFEQEQQLEKEANDILQSFSAETVEEMKEPGFHSISAYHEKWDTGIPTKNGETFNIQIGLRVDAKEGKLNIAIGTPIITSGY